MSKVIFLSIYLLLSSRSAFSTTTYQPPRWTHLIVCSELQTTEHKSYRKLSAYIPADTGPGRRPTFIFSKVNRDTADEFKIVDQIQETAEIPHFNLSMTSNVQGKTILEALTLDLGRSGQTKVATENGRYYVVSTAMNFYFSERTEVSCNYFFLTDFKPAISGSN